MSDLMLGDQIFQKMVEPEGETSNQLFETLAEWERYLQHNKIRVPELKR